MTKVSDHGLTRLERAWRGEIPTDQDLDLRGDDTITSPPRQASVQPDVMREVLDQMAIAPDGTAGDVLVQAFFDWLADGRGDGTLDERSRLVHVAAMAMKAADLIGGTR